MHIGVFGSTGMLGAALVEAGQRVGLQVTAFQHSRVDIAAGEQVAQALAAYRPEVIINAAGVIPQSGRSVTEMTRANAIGPHILAQVARTAGTRLIHVSTDCVFSGRLRDGMSHTAEDELSPVDPYGWSKAIGEPHGEGVMTVRTSFMGPQHGAWGWLLSNPPGTVVPGYRYAFWSGSTVYEVARALIRVALGPQHDGTFHLATTRPITKHRAMQTLNEAFGLGLEVQPTQEPHINRALKHSSILGPPLRSFAEALDDHVRMIQER